MKPRPGIAPALRLGLAGLLALAAAARLPGAAPTAASAPSVAAPAPVLQLRVQGAIGPATAEYVLRGLQRAHEEHAQLVVLQMDTPGGLDTAMREIIKAVLASPVPVAGFVAPSGARAASAGTYILYACHAAAMAPATNLGAATPIAIGLPTPGAEPGPAPTPPRSASAPQPAGGQTRDALSAKRLHDAAAYMRGLAQLRGRNAVWAERAVREAVSLAANEALDERVIDLVAADLPELLRRLDGRELRAGERIVRLATAGAAVIGHEPDWRGRLLAVISEPSVALVLMMLGIYGLLFEFMSPGFVAPGVIGGICLLLALFGLQLLPINHAGLALIVLGVAFLVAEAFVPSFGVLGLGGIAAFVFGALLLIDSDVPGLGIPRGLVFALALASALVVGGIAAMATRSRSRPLVAGRGTLVGAVGEVLEAGDPDGHEGWARVQGETWRVRIGSDRALEPGQAVRVRSAEGATLEVEPLRDDAASRGG